VLITLPLREKAKSHPNVVPLVIADVKQSIDARRSAGSGVEPVAERLGGENVRRFLAAERQATLPVLRGGPGGVRGQQNVGQIPPQ